MFLWLLGYLSLWLEDGCRSTRKVNGYPNDLQDLVLADGSVPVHVVQSEGPLQLLQRLPPGGQVQGHDVLLKVQHAVGVGVEAAEHVAGVLAGVGVGEEAGVDAFKLLLADLAAGTLLQEGLVPGAELGLAVLGVGLQILQQLLGQSAALRVPHLHRGAAASVVEPLQRSARRLGLLSEVPNRIMVTDA